MRTPENTEGGVRSQWLGPLLSLSYFFPFSLPLFYPLPPFNCISDRTIRSRECRRDVNACKILAALWTSRRRLAVSFILFAQPVRIIRINLTLTTRVSWERCILRIIIPVWKFVGGIRVNLRPRVSSYIFSRKRGVSSRLKYYFNTWHIFIIDITCAFLVLKNENWWLVVQLFQDEEDEFVKGTSSHFITFIHFTQCKYNNLHIFILREWVLQHLCLSIARRLSAVTPVARISIEANARIRNAGS